MSGETTNAAAVSAIVALVFLGVLGWVWFGGGWRSQSAETTDSLYMRIATEGVEQYRVRQQNGTPADKCVHAAFVAAAYRQTKNERAYTAWKAIELVDCNAAGIRRPNRL